MRFLTRCLSLTCVCREELVKEFANKIRNQLVANRVMSYDKRKVANKVVSGNIRNKNDQKYKLNPFQIWEDEQLETRAGSSTLNSF